MGRRKRRIQTVLHRVAGRPVPSGAARPATSPAGCSRSRCPARLSRRLLWFRPEIIKTVSWGGDPTKPVAADSGERLRPRHSFALWREEVRLHSHPWTASDLEAADELQRRAIEVDLERRLLSEQRAVRARDDLIAVVSHDLRNPLSAILMQAELMLKTASAGGEESSRRLRVGAERIRRSATHMKALIDDLLDLARIEAQRFALNLQSVESRVLVEEALLAASPLAEAKRITLAAELIDSPRLEADPERIFRVLSNLLGNAIKFTPRRGHDHGPRGASRRRVVDHGRRHGPRHCRRPTPACVRALLEGPASEPESGRVWDSISPRESSRRMADESGPSPRTAAPG